MRKIIVFYAFLMACNSPTEKNTTNGANQVKLPSKVALRSLNLNEINHYKDYDFYLLYLEHRPRHISYAISLVCRDSVLYSYTSYLNNIVSTYYPPVYYDSEDSIYFSTTYREYTLDNIDSINTCLIETNFYKFTSPQIRFKDSDNSRWLIVYDKKHPIYSVYNWKIDSEIETKIVSRLKKSFMYYDPALELDLRISDTTMLQNHIPKF